MFEFLISRSKHLRKLKSPKRSRDDPRPWCFVALSKASPCETMLLRPPLDATIVRRI